MTSILEKVEGSKSFSSTVPDNDSNNVKVRFIDLYLVTIVVLYKTRVHMFKSGVRMYQTGPEMSWSLSGVSTKDIGHLVLFKPIK